ncbi:MAG TPA: hypothetical protein VG518_07485 [Solirubrobacterales bacterium]|nr:hypothetical protein [Solirubrobacterales bacterium]
MASLLALCAAPAAAGKGRGEAWIPRQAKAYRAVGGTALAATITATHAQPSVHAVLDSLAMLAASLGMPKGEAASPPQAERPPAHVAPPPGEVAADPSSIPPASAGTNGTEIPQADREQASRLVARSPSSAGPSAILLTGIALAPPEAPEAIKAAINAANTIVGRPYIWGGGHGSWYSGGYDCSGSVSFALHGGGLIPEPLTSKQLESWGAPGPGRWLTVYANPGHTFAVIAGLRWDTVGDAHGSGPRWHLAPADTTGFVARHVPGY